MTGNQKIWLVGCGPMAVEYALVLKDLNCQFEVVGRGEDSASQFEKKTGINGVIRGGVANALKKYGCPNIIIIATGVEQLANTTIDCIINGAKRLLVEKPGGINLKQAEKIKETALDFNSDVYIAYNRRFYSSVMKARELIAEDGGVSSFTFEVTEWGHVIANHDKPKEVLENWFIANSTHVCDTAFFLGGPPQDISCYSSGSLPWHSRGSVYTGSGHTTSGALFSYHGDWAAPGRWAVEILSPKRRFILRPMEELQVQKIGTITVQPVEIDDELDKKFKPGLYKQVTSFLNGDCESLCTISEQVEMIKIYEKMAAYSEA